MSNKRLALSESDRRVEKLKMFGENKKNKKKINKKTTLFRLKKLGFPDWISDKFQTFLIKDRSLCRKGRLTIHCTYTRKHQPWHGCGKGYRKSQSLAQPQHRRQLKRQCGLPTCSAFFPQVSWPLTNVSSSLRSTHEKGRR